MHRVLRVGTVPYLVGRPLDGGLDREDDFQVERRAPSELVRALRAGDVDVALVSSIELFRRPGYRYLDGIAVCGEGFVGSVQVFLRKPIEEVRTVALDPASEAAAALVRVLLSQPDEGNAKPRREFIEVEKGSDPASAWADAWLEIGDAALRRYLTPGAPPVFNPSQEWTQQTGLPFVFAAWIVRPGVELSSRQLEAFARARARGAESVGALAEEAARTWKLPVEACRRYLEQECRYDPGQQQRKALLAFRDAAARLGLCEADLRPEPIAVPAEHVA